MFFLFPHFVLDSNNSKMYCKFCSCKWFKKTITKNLIRCIYCGIGPYATYNSMFVIMLSKLWLLFLTVEIYMITVKCVNIINRSGAEDYLI